SATGATRPGSATGATRPGSATGATRPGPADEADIDPAAEPLPPYQPLDADLKEAIREKLIDEKTLAEMQRRLDAVQEKMFDLSSDSVAPEEERRHKTARQVARLLKEEARRLGLHYAETPLLGYFELLESEDHPVGAAIEPESVSLQSQGTTVARQVDGTPPEQLFEPFRAAALSGVSRNAFAWWKIEDRGERVPTLQEQGVREAVVQSLREVKARPVAEQRAKELLASLKTENQSLEAVFAARVEDLADAMVPLGMQTLQARLEPLGLEEKLEGGPLLDWLDEYLKKLADGPANDENLQRIDSLSRAGSLLRRLTPDGPFATLSAQRKLDLLAQLYDWLNDQPGTREKLAPIRKELATLTVTGEPDGEPIEVRSTPPFTWLSKSTAPSANPFLPMMRPELSTVPGVPEVGEEFMQTVFEEMQVGESQVLADRSASTYYVIEVTDAAQARREQFAAEFPTINTFFSPYPYVVNEDRQQVQQEWTERLRDRYAVKWTRPAAQN
ncbi:MAG: hypothetical protein ACREJB_00595, partial [Planctomycetaceae bacterium]